MRPLILLILLGLLFAPASMSLAGSQDQGFGVDSDETMVFGNARVVSTTSGQIFVEIDQSLPRSAVEPDGNVDLVFRFIPRKRRPEYRGISFELERAMVLYSSKRLTLMTSDGNILAHFSLDRRPSSASESNVPVYEDPARDLSGTIRIYRGAQLSRHFGSDLPGPGDIRLMDEFEPEGGCNAGGPGATSCSYTCAGGGTCSVTCGSGYYACCNGCNDCKCVRA